MKGSRVVSLICEASRANLPRLIRSLDRCVLVQRLLGFLMHGLEVEDELFDGSRERVGRLVLVVTVNNQAVAAADVNPSVGREPGRSG